MRRPLSNNPLMPPAEGALRPVVRAGACLACKPRYSTPQPTIAPQCLACASVDSLQLQLAGQTEGWQEWHAAFEGLVWAKVGELASFSCPLCYWAA